MGRLVCIVGGQFGSEAKGAVAGFLAQHDPNDVLAIRVAGPNAGHTVYDPAGHEWKLRCIPAAVVKRPDAMLAIAAGSEIDQGVLQAEMAALNAGGFTVAHRLTVDGQATVITEKHQLTEKKLVGRIGSTGKGIGAARSDRLMRTANTWSQMGWGDANVAALARAHLLYDGSVHVEGAQGFGLGLHAGYYPYCTSSDCRAIDFLAMAGISPWDPYVTEFEVWVVLRVRPIRVAGNSGPLLGETTWEQLGLLPETTTVTGKTRRVGEWDTDLALRAIEANGSNVKIALTMVDTEDGAPLDVVKRFEEELERRVDLVGLGPDDYQWRTSL